MHVCAMTSRSLRQFCGAYQLLFTCGCRSQRSLHTLRRFSNLARSGTVRQVVYGRQNHVRYRPFAKNLLFSRRCSLLGTSNTVFALSSGHGKCGVAVVRTTGPKSRQCLLSLAGMSSPPEPRKAVLRKLRDPTTEDTIDHALVLWFPAPHSFTGEDCAEFHIHGGPSVVLATLTALGKIPHCSHAQAGDFTKRAFFNGKLELTEVEGLADLIHAETEAQRKQALRQMEGDLGKMYAEWTQRLLKDVAHVEAFIDFGEDENIEDNVITEVTSNVRRLLGAIEDHLNDGRRGERLRSGVHVAILGAPNVGKSSLLNILCQRPAAIVSPYAGTTRDVVESALDIRGYPVVLSDTAGLRQAEDPVEQEGVRRALSRVESADLCVLIGDLSLTYDQLMMNSSRRLSLSQLARLLLYSSNNECSSEGPNTIEWVEHALDHLSPSSTVVVLNKTDLLPDSAQSTETKNKLQLDSDVESSLCWLSCKTGDGVGQFMDTFTCHLEQLQFKKALRGRIESIQQSSTTPSLHLAFWGLRKIVACPPRRAFLYLQFLARCGNPMTGNPSITQARHRQHLTQCTQLLNNFLSLVERGSDMLLDQAAEELRMAIREMGRITGKVGIEDILNVVFSDFCVGK